MGVPPTAQNEKDIRKMSMLVGRPVEVDLSSLYKSGLWFPELEGTDNAPPPPNEVKVKGDNGTGEAVTKVIAGKQDRKDKQDLTASTRSYNDEHRVLGSKNTNLNQDDLGMDESSDGGDRVFIPGSIVDISNEGESDDKYESTVNLLEMMNKEGHSNVERNSVVEEVKERFAEGQGVC
ncbi:hypothetical protein ABZP36_035919 [Zizania latifolia]